MKGYFELLTRQSRKALGLWVAATLVLGLASVGAAADPAFVGVLALTVDDEGARHLQLSDEVRNQLKELIDRREKEAVEIAMRIKDLPPEVRAAQLAPFVAESEQLGMKLLSLEQRSRLESAAVADGRAPASFAEPEMDKRLGLTAEQVAEIKRLLEERAKAMTSGGDDDRRAAQIQLRPQTSICPHQRTKGDLGRNGRFGCRSQRPRR